MWRLAVDAIPGSRFRPWTCPCQHAAGRSVGRQHAFWDCAVATAVRAQFSETRLPCGPVRSVQQAEVWLLRRDQQEPDSRWQQLAVCAIAAMEHGRQVMWARMHAGELGDALVQPAANLAVERFWWLLAEVGLA